MASQKKFDKADVSILVSASEVGEVSFCELRYLNRLKGVKVNKSAIYSSKRGSSLHDKQNRVGRDSRCFVATYLYSADSEEVLRLRVFRDQFLKYVPFGSIIISIYYFISPHFIRLCRRSKLLTTLSDRFVKCILFFA